MNNQRGFTIMGLLSALFFITFFLAIVGGIVYAFYNASRAPSLEGDTREVRIAVADYVTASSAAGTTRWPTKDGKLPLAGKYAEIDFYSSFVDGQGMLRRFYPDFLNDRPRHWSAGVWRIDSVGDVSVDMKPEEY